MKLLAALFLAATFCGAYATHPISHYCHGCEAMAIEGQELTADEQAWVDAWGQLPGGNRYDQKGGAVPANYQRQKCRLRNMHFFNDSTKTGACNMGSCKINRQARLDTMMGCTIACCAYCSEDQPFITRFCIVIFKLITMAYMIYVGKYFWKVAQPHYKQSKKKKQMIGTFSIIVSSSVTIFFMFTLHFYFIPYHINFLLNGNSHEFMGSWFEPVFMGQFNVLDLINKFLEPYSNIMANTAFVAAQLNLIFLWAEIICPDEKGKKQMKTVVNVVKSRKFLQNLICCYACSSIFVMSFAIYSRAYLLTVVFTLFTWTSLQCYCICQFKRKGSKIIKELRAAAADREGGDPKLLKFAEQVTQIALSVGYMGMVIIFLLWGPQLMLVSGVFGGGLKSSLSMSWPEGGSLRCWYEVQKEFFHSLRKASMMRILYLIAMMLEKKASKQKMDKERMESTVVSEGDEQKAAEKEMDTSSSDGGTGSGASTGGASSD